VSWLLDTNVISEWTKPRPDDGVGAWLDAVDEDALFLSSLTFGEVWFGIEKLPPGRRRSSLEAFVDSLAERFAGRVLAVDQAVASRWGIAMRRARANGREPEVVDGLIAATALVHGLTVVTRNIGHFAAFGVPVHDPWTG
jgi:hypothetical protein